MPVLACPRCKARVEVADDATHATCTGCGFSAPRKPTRPAQATPPAPATPAQPAAPAPAAKAAAPVTKVETQPRPQPTVVRTTPTTTAPAAGPVAVAKTQPRIAVVPAGTPKMRKDRPGATAAVAWGTTFALFASLSWNPVAFLFSIPLAPTLAGWLGGLLTPGDRLTRTGYAAGAAALGVLTGLLVSGLLVAPFVGRLLGDRAPEPATLVERIVGTLPFVILGIALAAAAAWWLAQPSDKKEKKK